MVTQGIELKEMTDNNKPKTSSRRANCRSMSCSPNISVNDFVLLSIYINPAITPEIQKMVKAPWWF